jgi:hypothetical protein
MDPYFSMHPHHHFLLVYFSSYYKADFEILPAGCEADTGLIGAASLVLNELETY